MLPELFSMLKEDHAACVGAVGRRTMEALHSQTQIEKAEEIIPGFKTLIIAAYSYKTSLPTPAGVSKYAASLDYHRALPPLMSRAQTMLEENGYSARVLADISPFNERACALACGLGIQGDNGLLIVPEYGSYIFIASLLTDAELVPEEEDVPLETKTCSHCGACRRACPYDALGEGRFDFDRCLSDISQRRHVTDAELAMLKETGTLWGCDRCQDACPYNADVRETDIPAFLTDRLTDEDMEEIGEISNSAFKEKYSRYALSWRGAAVLRRNIQNLKKE